MLRAGGPLTTRDSVANAQPRHLLLSSNADCLTCIIKYIFAIASPRLGTRRKDLSTVFEPN